MPKHKFRIGQVVAKCIHYKGERKVYICGYGAIKSHSLREGTDGYILEGVGWWYTATMSEGTRMYLRALTKREYMEYRA